MKWEEQALKLQCGTRKRVQCCKDDNSMLINHDLKGISCYCFRCGFSSFLPHGIQCIAEIARRNKEYLSGAVNDWGINLPEDYTLDVPPQVATWYMQYGISAELAREYKIGYTNDLNRIVLPVFSIDGSNLDALQMRAIHSQMRPKYLNPIGPKISGALFWAGKRNSTVVMTEDILSAIKVGRWYYAVSILGTNLTDSRITSFVNNGITEVIIWLDGDQAGIKGRLQAMTKLSMRGIRCRYITTELDPKEYTKKDIMRYIHE